VLDREELYRKLATGIRKHREDENLTQEDLADRAGLTRSQLANIEKLRQRPPLEVIYKLAGALNVDLVELLPRQDEVINSASSQQVSIDYGGATHHVPPTAATYLQALGDTTKR
jgi:transcriptional regulator with XRE-family HTH domain